ncbi:hypothetical protein Poly30_03340 [Planctomycetes bacterium Poly30]|uniref:Uncharacterized protein n=1 Tax=Saltatorellus ferox TaxID=2528018 RepID=A0A518EL76_9BACT|nr:hypothetical protein Poly30_03340 [Planctomycetes bacterium Poly30]
MNRSSYLQAFGVGLVLVAGIATLLADVDSSPSCSSTAVRPWAVDEYAERVAAGPPEPWPTLRPGAVPPPTVTRTEDSITVGWPGENRESQVDWRNYERVAADASMRAALPQVPGATLELLFWRVGNGPWLDPREGTPAAPQPTWAMDRDSEGEVSFILLARGTERRFHGASLFDRKTRVSLSTGSSWGLTGKDEHEMRIGVDTHAQHRASFLLEVPITYGAPVIKELALSGRSVTTFGASAAATFLARASGGIRSTGSRLGSGGQELILRWSPSTGPAKDEKSGWVALAFSPVGLAAKFEATIPGSGTWSSLHGGSQLPVLQAVPASTEAITLRYLPHAARVQFSLPLPSSQPAMDDLLQVRPKRARYDGEYSLGRVISQTLQVDPGSVSELRLRELHYPITVDDDTIAELIDRIRAETGAAETFLDPDEFVFRSTSWSSLERLRRWGSALLDKLRP